ncbi:hypothetical protein CFC21_111211 [Triticum aestivum]|uniref:F-box associated beta-propeller type 3 domain-containing protein n=2 Tax=Triticum aestivum TaxID=4565 RepID=A0A3B6TRG6_WHEAT|nr:F-box protein At5g49610-like [Triticum aestivum]KAF7111168.1 hypothetical protein CFC21_111211 [Triticum aestivum]
MRRSRMPDKRGAAVIDDLPDDIIFGKILITLPPKDIGRCRMVRTSWRSATFTPEFMAEHRRRQPSLPIIDGNGQLASFVTLRADASAGATSQQIWPFLCSCRKSCCEIRLHASSDGFLIVSRGDRFYICNPTTRKHAHLPFPRPPLPRSSCIKDISIHGLYQHKSTGKYRLLLSNIHKKEATLYVLTVGANESRSIQVVMPTLPSPSPEQTRSLLCKLCWPSPVHYRGNLHWLFRPDRIPGIRSTGDIIVFDTEAETFRWMRNPANDYTMNRLFDMEGTPAFLGTSAHVNTATTAMDVWVMQDYEAETWAFKYRIDVSMIEASRLLDSASPKETSKRNLPLDSTVRFFSGMTPLNERGLLVSFNDKHVLRCDTDGKFLGLVTIGKRQYCMELTGHRLQESIMPIPSGEMQGEDEDFPFSREHAF